MPSKKNRKTNVIVFGIGQIFHELKTYIYDNYNVIAFTDNDMEKQGAYLDNIEIINPQDIFSRKFDKILIMVTGSQKHVVKQLIEFGVAKEDYPWSKFFNVEC